MFDWIRRGKKEEAPPVEAPVVIDNHPKYFFEPRADITAYELASLLRFYKPGEGGTALPRDAMTIPEDFWSTQPQGQRSNFRLAQ